MKVSSDIADIVLNIQPERRLNGWQIGSRILIAIIVAILFFGVGALWERRRWEAGPRVYLHAPEIMTEQVQFSF